MGSSAAFLELLVELMAGFGPVTRKRMFGGAGFFRDGLMFALVSRDTLYLKCDAETAERFDSQNLSAFTYTTKTGPNTILSYRRAPDVCLEDPDAMTEWCRLAFEAALRSSKPKRRSARG